MRIRLIDGEVYSDGIGQWRCVGCLLIEAVCQCGRRTTADDQDPRGHHPQYTSTDPATASTHGAK